MLEYAAVDAELLEQTRQGEPPSTERPARRRFAPGSSDAQVTEDLMDVLRVVSGGPDVLLTPGWMSARLFQRPTRRYARVLLASCEQDALRVVALQASSGSELRARVSAVRVFCAQVDRMLVLRSRWWR